MLPLKSQDVVHLIDDDTAVRESLTQLLTASGYRVTPHCSAAAFMAAGSCVAGCIVSDVRMPDMSGLEMLEKLRADTVQTPVVFITGHSDVPVAVAAMKLGAFDFLIKPFKLEDLVQVLDTALSSGQSQDDEELRWRIGQLTPREVDVFRLLLDGGTNKSIARVLGLSPRTVEIHRANLMTKMGTKSLPALIRLGVRHGSLLPDGPTAGA